MVGSDEGGHEPTPASVRYESPEEDSARWDGFAFRAGDIVISTRSKSGTTWMQMICALLVFQTPELPAPLATMSPWVDMLIEPLDVVVARLEAQHHRRFMKTHTPLDGLPRREEVTYVVVARHPLDAAVSLYHQGTNIDRARMRELTGQAEPDTPPEPRPDIYQWLVEWIDTERDPVEHLDSLDGTFRHLTDAWERRDEPNVELVHYADLADDLEGQMRSLAQRLGFAVPEERWPQLVHAAGFDAMRAAAANRTPVTGGIFKDPVAFFRSGRSGEGRSLLSAEELTRYERRASKLAPPDLLAWLHRPLS